MKRIRSLVQRAVSKLGITAIVFVALIGVSSAGLVSALTTGVIYACVNNSSGNVHIVGSNSNCGSNETLLSWNSQGPQGATGPAGATGAPGASGPQGPGLTSFEALNGTACIANGVAGKIQITYDVSSRASIACQQVLPFSIEGVGSNPSGVAVNSGTGRIYVADNFNPGSVFVIDRETNSIVTAIAVGAHPYGIAVNAAMNRVYATNESGRSVSVIDGTNNTVTTTIPTHNNEIPRGVAFNATTNRIYLALHLANRVQVIDGTNNATLALVDVGMNPEAVAVNATTNRIYVTNYSSGTVSVIDGASNTVAANIAVGASPFGVGVNTATNRVFVAINTAAPPGAVVVIDGNSNAILATTPVGFAPHGLAVNPATGEVYVGNYNDKSVSVIDGDTSEVVRTILIGSNPLQVATDPATNRVYVTKVGSAVAVIQE